MNRLFRHGLSHFHQGMEWGVCVTEANKKYTTISPLPFPRARIPLFDGDYMLLGGGDTLHQPAYQYLSQQLAILTLHTALVARSFEIQNL